MQWKPAPSLPYQHADTLYTSSFVWSPVGSHTADFISWMPWIDAKDSPKIKPSALVPPHPGFHPLCLQCSCLSTRLQQAAEPHRKHASFVSIIGSADSSRSTTGQGAQISWPQALGQLALYRPSGVYDLSGCSHDSLPTVSLAEGAPNNIYPSRFLLLLITQKP